MAGFRTNPETGQREFVEEHRPTEQPAASSGPPMQAPGWVEHFLSGPVDPKTYVVPPRPRGPGGRPYHRKSIRRVR